MADKIEYSRMLVKRTAQTGEVPTIPPVTAVTLNQMIPTDLFVGEFYLNEVDDLLWIRTENGILPISLSGSTGTTSNPNLTQVLFEGNATNGYNIEVSNGDTIVFSGLSSGVTSQFLGIDASGNTIVSSVTPGTPDLESVLAVGNTTGLNNISVNTGYKVEGQSGGNWVRPETADGYLELNTDNELTIVGITSGVTDIVLSYDPDTKFVKYQAITGSTGSNGTSGSSGSSGISGTNGSSGSSGIGGLGLSAKSIIFTGDTGWYSGATAAIQRYDVVFSQPFGSTNYSISVMFTKDSTTDPMKSIYNNLPTTVGVFNKTVSGFTFEVNAYIYDLPNQRTEIICVANGEVGLPGTSGTAGSSGTSGVSFGTSGTAGTSGANGTSGSSGVNGTSGTSFASPYVGNIKVVSGQTYVTLPTTATTTSATTINFDNGNVQEVTLGANTTFTFTNTNAGATYILVVRQSSGGSNTITWPTDVTWAGGTTPTMTTTANKFDVYTFIYDGSRFFGSYVQNFT